MDRDPRNLNIAGQMNPRRLKIEDQMDPEPGILMLLIQWFGIQESKS